MNPHTSTTNKESLGQLTWHIFNIMIGVNKYEHPPRTLATNLLNTTGEANTYLLFRYDQHSI